jgi:membrane protein
VAVIAITLLLGAASSQLIALAPDLTGFGTVLAFVATVAINTAAFLVAFQLLAVDRHAWRDLLPGAVLAAVGYVALQLLGQLYVKRTISGAEDTYGTFAVVIGLLGWLYVLAQLVLVAMEVNAVHTHRLWPRSLVKDDPTAADEEIVRIAARSARLRTGTRIFVEFDEPNREHRIEEADTDPERG